MNTSRTFALVLGAAVLVGLAACDTAEPSNLIPGTGPVVASQLTGAIYTSGEGTTPGACDGVNLNIYPSKDAVYLNGGPRGGGSGLPEGEYYVQVTEPDGTLLGTSLDTFDETPAVVDATGRFVNCHQLSAILRRASTDVSGGPVAPDGYDTTTNAGGEYKVWVSNVRTFPGNSSKTDNFKVQEDAPPQPQNGRLIVRKFYDANANGVMDGGEGLLTGWLVEISGWGTQPTTFDQVTGAGTYSLFEYLPTQTNWVVTRGPAFPNPAVDVEVVADQTTTYDFGNYCTTPSGGLTLGFWSNRNGKAAFNALTAPSALASLTALNLRNANGSHFDPTTYDGNPTATQFRAWLLAGNATNMAYMLSVQLAAMHLNVRNGNVSGGAFVAGFGGTINQLMDAANTSLGLYPDTRADGANADQRAAQEALKNYLDALNNNGPVVSPTACAYTFPE